MKVLLLGPYPPPQGGVQTNLVAIREYLRARSVPCMVINLTRHRQDNRDGLYFPRGSRELIGLLLRLDYDIAHLHFGGDLHPRLLLLALLIGWMPGRRAVLTFHSGGYPSSEAGKKTRRWSLAGLALRSLDRLIGVNRELETFFSRLGVPERKIRVVCPFADARFDPSTPLPPKLDAFFTTHRPLLITVSGLEPEYDLPLQINAMEEILAAHPQAGLAILGTGSREEELRALIESKPYAKNILLAGDIPHASTLRALSEADLFLRTTLYDGDSISVREALAIGIPSVVSDNGMRPPGVRLFTIGDRAAMVRVALDTLREPGQRLASTAVSSDGLGEVYAIYNELASDNLT